MKRWPSLRVWCDSFLRVTLSSILDPLDISMIVEDILVISTLDVLESRDALHHICGVALSVFFRRYDCTTNMSNMRET